MDPTWNLEKRMQVCHTWILAQCDPCQNSDLQNYKIINVSMPYFLKLACMYKSRTGAEMFSCMQSVNRVTEEDKEGFLEVILSQLYK